MAISCWLNLGGGGLAHGNTQSQVGVSSVESWAWAVATQVWLWQTHHQYLNRPLLMAVTWLHHHHLPSFLLLLYDTLIHPRLHQILLVSLPLVDSPRFWESVPILISYHSFLYFWWSFQLQDFRLRGGLQRFLFFWQYSLRENNKLDNYLLGWMSIADFSTSTPLK